MAVGQNQWYHVGVGELTTDVFLDRDLGLKTQIFKENPKPIDQVALDLVPR